MSTDRPRRVQPQGSRVHAEPGHHPGLPGPPEGGGGPAGAQSEHTEGPGWGDVAWWVGSIRVYVYTCCLHLLSLVKY